MTKATYVLVSLRGDCLRSVTVIGEDSGRRSALNLAMQDAAQAAQANPVPVRAVVYPGGNRRPVVYDPRRKDGLPWR